MIELSPEAAVEYLIRRRIISSESAATARLLTGGVSNLVLRIDIPSDESMVLKQSRTRLRTEADWFSRLERVFREVEAQRALYNLLPPGSVPRVVFEDRDNFCYGMTAVPENHRVWKQQLLSGDIDQQLFVEAGRLLATIHRRSLRRPELLSAPTDVSVFQELRVDPYYHWIAERHPAIRPAIGALIVEMSAHALCLVHADFSPKNLLVHDEGFTLVDFETVHFGDPAFDLGFFFSHLCLKAIALPHVRKQLMDGIQSGWAAYREEWPAGSSDSPDGISEISKRAVRHLAGCLLARVDGKSPVDYLTNPLHQALVRDLSLDWLVNPPGDLDTAFARFSNSVDE